MYNYEQLHKQIAEVLEKYDKSYTDKGIDANLDCWVENKKPLLELLSKHPNFIKEELAIVFEIQTVRDIDGYTVQTHCNNLCQFIREHNNGIISDDLNLSLYRASQYNNHNYQFICKEQAEVVNSYAGIDCKSGQKASRVINKICAKYGIDKLDGYNAIFAKLADSLNPLTIQRKVILSVHPCDFLEMSNRNNSWRSCHTLDDGEYQAGTLSYMNDDVSMILYTVDDDVTENYYKAPKRTRQVFAYQNGILLQSRLYPNTDDDTTRKTYRDLVQSIFTDCLELPNLWTLKTEQEAVNTYITTGERALHYEDYVHSCYHANVSLLKAINTDGINLVVGTESYCVECYDVLENAENVLCSNCDEGYYYCENCGARMDSSDVRWIDGEPYCDDCTEYCEHCGEYTTGEVYEATNSRGNTVYICEDCLDNNYFTCEECGEIHHYNNGAEIDYRDYCPDCVSKYFTRCESCGDYVHVDNATEIDGYAYCESCAQEVEEHAEEYAEVSA